MTTLKAEICHRVCRVLPDHLLDAPVLHVLRGADADHGPDGRHATARTCRFCARVSLML